VPLSAPAVEADGSIRTLGQMVGARPAILMFGYYRCRNLCATSLAPWRAPCRPPDYIPDPTPTCCF